MLASSFTPNKIEAGCDEAGRGCLAGPVFAAAVILPKDFKNSILNDSKQVSEKKRDQLRILIERDALDWAIGIVDQYEIDKINILNASFLAMHRALDQLKMNTKLILVDGNRFKIYKKIKHECIIKGDGKYASIAAASILAKTHRDEFMARISLSHPEYQWNKNKGYPTKNHRSAIEKYGSCKFHRKSFRLLK